MFAGGVVPPGLLTRTLATRFVIRPPPNTISREASGNCDISNWYLEASRRRERPAHPIPTPARTCQGLAGCYALTLGLQAGPFPWKAPAIYQPPPRFELKTTGADTAGDGTIFRSVVPNPPAFGTFGPAWGIHDEGAVEAWSTGMAGVSLRLWSYGDHLEGHAKAFTDFEDPRVVQPTASARADRVSCRPQSSGVPRRRRMH